MIAAPVRLGFVGCGAVVRERHLPALARVREIEVLAVADVDRGAAAEVARHFAVERRYGSVEELVADGDVEAVAVCTPPAAHLASAIAALEADKHLFVEKPVSVSLADADALVERGARSSRAALVGFNLRWHRNLLRARRLVREGALGRVHTIASTFSDPLVRKPLPPWRSRRAAGGGVLFDRAVHHFDLWRFLLDDEVDAVFALGRSAARDDDGAVVTAHLRSGAIATTVVLDDTAVRHALALFGSEGALEIDVLRFDGLIRLAREELPGSPRVRLHRLRQRLGDARGSIAAIRRGGDFDAAYEHEWRHFADATRHGTPVGATLADGRAALEIAVAAARSVESGRLERVETRERDGLETTSARARA